MDRGYFNKTLLAKLLQKAMGDRTMTKYANHAGVSLTYLSGLLKEQRINPPTATTIKKLAENAHCGVTYYDLMNAAGHLPNVEGQEQYHIQEKTNSVFIEKEELKIKMCPFKGFTECLQDGCMAWVENDCAMFTVPGVVDLFTKLKP